MRKRNECWITIKRENIGSGRQESKRVERI